MKNTIKQKIVVTLEDDSLGQFDVDIDLNLLVEKVSGLQKFRDRGGSGRYFGGAIVIALTAHDPC